jgi:hypothetical protein
MNKFYGIIFLFFTQLLIAQNKIAADLIVHNAKVYTVNARFDIAEAIAVKGGKILFVGKNQDVLKKYTSKNVLNAQGKPIYPGFIDAHAHFYNYGLGLNTVDLVGTKSWDEIIEKLKDFSSKNNEGWLIGRGWDQNDWEVKTYPNKKRLDELFPNRPVLLTRVDGHAVIVNQAALDMADMKPNQTIEGGEIETKDGQLTGILIDNAIGYVSSKRPAPTEGEAERGLMAAQKNCFAVGLTTVVDCGLDFDEVNFIKKMHGLGKLKMRMYVMLSDDRKNYEYLFKTGIIKTNRLNVRSFKLYLDGALGSRGACLLHPYSDRPNYFGFLRKDINYYKSVIPKIAEHGMQACTHAIGDSANRVILNLYADVLKSKNDKRWRVEHAQVVNPSDFALFGQYNIIPSVQPTHATSDMYWAGDRLGQPRVKGAYAFRQLMEQNNWVPLGTDFPVEDINPMNTFFAAVVRKDAKGFPTEGYQMENALTREQTLRGMTIWAAKANFEEKEKGSIEIGKFADFILLDQDLMTVSEDLLLKTKVLKTFLNGEKVFGD